MDDVSPQVKRFATSKHTITQHFNSEEYNASKSTKPPTPVHILEHVSGALPQFHRATRGTLAGARTLENLSENESEDGRKQKVLKKNFGRRVRE